MEGDMSQLSALIKGVNMGVDAQQFKETLAHWVSGVTVVTTVVEGKLMGINPYGQPGVEAYKRNMMSLLRAAGTQDINKKNTAE